MVFMCEILFLVIKFVLNKTSLTWHRTKLNMLFFVALLITRMGCLFLCKADILPCSVMSST